MSQRARRLDLIRVLCEHDGLAGWPVDLLRVVAAYVPVPVTGLLVRRISLDCPCPTPGTCGVGAIAVDEQERVFVRFRICEELVMVGSARGGAQVHVRERVGAGKSYGPGPMGAHANRLVQWRPLWWRIITHQTPDLTLLCDTPASGFENLALDVVGGRGFAAYRPQRDAPWHSYSGRLDSPREWKMDGVLCADAAHQVYPMYSPWTRDVYMAEFPYDASKSASRGALEAPCRLQLEDGRWQAVPTPLEAFHVPLLDGEGFVYWVTERGCRVLDHADGSRAHTFSWIPGSVVQCGPQPDDVRPHWMTACVSAAGLLYVPETDARGTSYIAVYS